MKNWRRVAENIWYLRNEEHIHIIEIIDGMLVTETHGRFGSHKQIWKRVKQE